MPRRKRQGEQEGRDKGSGSGKTVIRYRRHAVHPLEFRVRLVREALDGKKNGTLTPSDVTGGSGLKV